MADGAARAGEDSDGEPEIGMDALGADTLAILQQFLDEKESAKQDGGFEDFGLSQFWYTDGTAQALAREIMSAADRAQGAAEGAAQGAAEGTIAIMCSPTCLKGMRQLEEGKARAGVKVLEYDRRFGDTYPEEFVFYDVNADPRATLIAENPDMDRAFDAVLADPPYTDADTVLKTMDGIEALAKLPITLDGTAGQVPGRDFTPAIFISALISRSTFLARGFRPTAYRLSFASKFATPMYAYTNYPPPEGSVLGRWLEDDEVLTGNAEDG